MILPELGWLGSSTEGGKPPDRTTWNVSFLQFNIELSGGSRWSTTSHPCFR